MTKILEKASLEKTNPAKSSNKNQKAYVQMLFLCYNGIRLLVGHQKSTGEYVQYCITAKKKSQPGTLTLGLESRQA